MVEFILCGSQKDFTKYQAENKSVRFEELCNVSQLEQGGKPPVVHFVGSYHKARVYSVSLFYALMDTRARIRGPRRAEIIRLVRAQREYSG